MKQCKHLGIWGLIASILVLIGALNWGLVGLGMLMGGEWDLVMLILGSVPYAAEIVYILVGASAIVMLVGGNCKKCKAEGGSMSGGM